MTLSPAAQAEWFERLEEETQAFRSARAVHHDAIAAKHRASMRLELLDHRPGQLERADEFRAELDAVAEYERVGVTAREAAAEALAELEQGTGPYRGMTGPRRDEIRARLELLVEQPATPRLPLLLESVAKHAMSETWHERRAKGQRERFRRREGCCVQSMRITCSACGEHGVVGEDREIPIGCDIGRLCVSCRAKAKKRHKIRMGFARHAKIREAMRLGLFRRHMHGGRWSEKFLTLTIPHFQSGEVREAPCERCNGASDCPHHTKWKALPAQRIDLLLRSWRFFSVRLNRYWREVRRTLADRGFPETASPAIHRAFEWTPGFDLQGHPHLHAWLFSPWLAIDPEHARANVWSKRYQKWLAARPPQRGPGSGPGAVVRWKLKEPRERQPDVTSMWRASLRDAGLETVDLYPDLMLDIRPIPTDFGNFGHELLKAEDALRLSSFAHRRDAGADAIDYAAGWSLAEEAAGERVSVELFARVYEALEGRRIVQATPGFLAVAPPPACPHCGESGRFHVYLLDPMVKPEARCLQERAPP